MDVGGATRGLIFQWHLVSGGYAGLSETFADQDGDSFTFAKPSGASPLEFDLTVRKRVVLLILENDLFLHKFARRAPIILITLIARETISGSTVS